MSKYDLQKIEDAINSRPCPHCGAMHEVHLRLESSPLNHFHALAIPSGVISVGFSENACGLFRQAVFGFLRHMDKGETPFPLP